MIKNNSKSTKKSDKPLPPKSVRKGVAVLHPDKGPKPVPPKRPHKLIRKIRGWYFRAKESILFVRFKARIIPYTINLSANMVTVGFSAFIILLALNLFEIVEINFFNFIKCVALYFVIEEARYYSRIRRRKSK